MFVILESACIAGILYIIHVMTDAIIFVQYMIFFNMHAPLVLTFLRYIIFNWESQEDGVQPCDCPTI